MVGVITMPSVRAITIDGTVIEADKFESKQKGIKLQRKPQKQGSKPETIGFVPFDRLMYVIPEEVTHNIDDLDELPA